MEVAVVELHRINTASRERTVDWNADVTGIRGTAGLR